MLALQLKGHFADEMLKEAPFADMINETNRILAKAVKKGIKTEIPEVMRNNLFKDVFVFSGCKTYIQLKEASSLLWDKDHNRVKSFERFYKDIEQIYSGYNKNYLDAEYYFARGSAESASQWAQYEANGDNYDLQYRTAGDDKVRASHAALDRTTLPASDPFWELYFTPNGWKCRCRVIQVRKDKYPRSNSAQAIDDGNKATTGRDAIFRFNPGQQKVIFPPHHPYYKVKERIGDILSSIKKIPESNSETND